MSRIDNSRLPPFRMTAAPTLDTLFTWDSAVERVLARPVFVGYGSTSGRAGVHKPNGAWRAVFADGTQVTSHVSRWPADVPHPVGWVLVQREFRPPEWPGRFPLLADEKETKTAYTKRVKADVEAADKLSDEQLTAIYEDRKNATAEFSARKAREVKRLEEVTAAGRQKLLQAFMGVTS